MYITQIANLTNKFTINNFGCWVWKAYKDRDGYGKVGANLYSQYAHRVTYILVKGRIPKGLELDHLCHNPSCVNPNHLEAVTHKTNLDRRVRLALKTHCIRGHLYDSKNTYFQPTGGRTCRICQKKAVSEYQQRIKI